MNVFKTSYFFLFAFLILVSAKANCIHQFVVVTPEKTGTHLLTKLMTRLTSKEVHNCWEHSLTSAQLTYLLKETRASNKFLHIHALPTKELIAVLKKEKYKVCFLMRDPRDVLVSLLYYIEKGWAIGPCGLDKPYGQLPLETKLLELITGARYGFAAIDAIISRRLAWMRESPNFVYTSRFENLVGKNGGGSLKAQAKEIKRLAKYVGASLDGAKLSEIAMNLWGASPEEKTTFRQGKVGSWKQEFNTLHKKAFKERYASLLKDLKYEKNDNW